MWTQQKKAGVLAGSLAILLVGGAVAWYAFAPKPVDARSEAAPEGAVLREGTFRNGDALHETRGTVSLVDVGGRHVLRFEDYEATAGPAVYFYLTRAGAAPDAQGIEGEGLLVRTPTTTGQATLRGDFNLEIPEGVDVARYDGVAVWCERFDVLFGSATFA